MRVLRGKVAVVTGAAGGLDRVLRGKLQHQGAAVVEIDIPESGAGYPCDIADAGACTNVVQAILAKHEGIDILIHNAGITRFSRAAETPDDTLRRVMQVNFFGAVTLTRALLPTLVSRRGAIAVLSSIAGFSPLYGRAGYSASKHALRGYFETLRSEVGELGMDVMMVCPSFIATQDVRNGGITRPSPLRGQRRFAPLFFAACGGLSNRLIEYREFESITRSPKYEKAPRGGHFIFGGEGGITQGCTLRPFGASVASLRCSSPPAAARRTG